MIWIWKVLDNEELSESEIHEENSKVEYNIKKKLPQFLSRSAACMMDSMISRVTKTKSAAAIIRQYIAGDRRCNNSKDQQKRQDRIANYVMSSDEFEDTVLDLRENNGAKQSFEQWFDLANEYIDSTETKCHDRRHDSVERVVTWISAPNFVVQVKKYYVSKFKDEPEKIEDFPTQPSNSTVLNSFLPSNPYVGKIFYHGRIKLSRVIQKRSAHIDHMDTHYCHTQRRILKEVQIELLILHKQYCEDENELFEDLIMKVESDDKSKVPFGNPGFPIDSGVRPHDKIITKINSDGTNNVKNSGDHSYHLGSITPSVNLFQTVPEEIGHSWVRGKVVVTLNDSVFEPSSGWKHAAQLCLQIIERACLRAKMDVVRSLNDFQNNISKTEKEKLLKFIPSVVFISTDGGSDHKNTNVQNQAAMLGMVLLLNLHFCIGNRNAPDGSWINSIERIMSLLNLGLQWCSFERKKLQM